jgi:EAL domain-containing protein (putative c-di-GMP-specific phosphodiesterase class I)
MPLAGVTSYCDAIVLAMVELARAIGIKVTAERVEMVEQRDYLQSIECKELQGFLLSRPGTSIRSTECSKLKEHPASAAAARTGALARSRTCASDDFPDALGPMMPSP